MYRYGRHVKQDLEQAVQLYRAAGDKGMDAAQYNLGELYEAGEGVDKDEKEAVRWYRRAADEGNGFAMVSIN